ncbi:MAG: ATP-binding cassette domain-containing protein [Chloroflexi bacterium]|nr:ATP-binding cassette domain-containing protein [Chloroflexota bacterium]
MAPAPSGATPEGGSGRAATVEFVHVTKHFDSGARWSGTPGALNDLSLKVPAGRICVIVGPSGCGKTTSLKMVNRLIEPTSGQVLLDGVDIESRDVIDLRRSIGYVIQQTGLFPHQTVIENVAAVPRLLGWPAAKRSARSEELLALVGLDPAAYGTRYPAQLSGGERQRVGVARALAADPPIMLMDEPFGAVDPLVRERLQQEFLRLQRDLAKTILFVTHDVDEAIRLGDQVAVLERGGRLAQVGTPEEVLANPASDFVARFVGADRGLKRLSLVRVGQLRLREPATARVGEPATSVRDKVTGAFPYVLVVDDDGRPIGCADPDQLTGDGSVTASGLVPASPVLTPDTTLRDALSMLLTAQALAGVVVDAAGRATGVLTIDEIGDWFRMEAGRLRAGPSGTGMPAVG